MTTLSITAQLASLSATVASLSSTVTALAAQVAKLTTNTPTPVVPTPTPVTPTPTPVVPTPTPVVPTPTPVVPVPTTIGVAWVSPVNGSTLSKSVSISLTGSLMVNTEIWYNGANISTMTVTSGTKAIGIIDTTKLPNGSVVLTAQTWNSPAGQGTSTTLNASAVITVTISNPVVVAPTPTPVTPTPAPAPTATASFTYGVNDHFVAQGDLGVSQTTRLNLCTNLNVKCVRVDTYNTSSAPALLAAAQAYAAKGIEIIPTLLPPITGYANEQAAYAAGRAYGLAMVTACKSVIRRYECGNEWDIPCQNGDTSGGPNKTDYDVAKYTLIRGVLRGLYDGCKAADPTCTVMIGNAGWRAMGFTDLLWDDGVRWDVTIIHWYTSFGPIDAIQNDGPVVNQSSLAYYHSRYGVPIFLSEIGDNQQTEYSAAQGSAVTGMLDKIKAMATSCNIIGWCIYQLLDYGDGFSPLASNTAVPEPEYTAVKNWIIANPSSPTPAPTGRTALVGMYGSSGTTVSSWLGEKPDFTINNSFQDTGVSAGVSGLSSNNGYPTVIALDLGAQHYNCTDADYIAAAAGQYNAQFTSKVQSLLPYASSIYGIRIDPEFNLHGGGSSWSTWYDRSNVGPTVYKAAFNALAKICKQYLPNAKVIWNPNIENGSDVMPYFPGTQYCDIVGIDLYMQPQWSTTFEHYSTITTNGLYQFAALAKANNVPLMFCEWADMYSDASNLTEMAAWIKANNVVAHTYWNSNDALTVTSPNSSPILTGAKQAAFAAAFGNAAYTGTYWSKKATTMAFNNY